MPGRSIWSGPADAGPRGQPRFAAGGRRVDVVAARRAELDDDEFGNSVAQVEFAQAAMELQIVSILNLERYGLKRPVFPIAPVAQMYPFVYSSNDRATSAGYSIAITPIRAVSWKPGPRASQANSHCRPTIYCRTGWRHPNSFAYAERYEEGTQTPIETLEKKNGSCRDFALLFIEAVRCLGFGARFVTGYLYDPAVDGGRAMQGAGSTHAWADVYLPGAAGSSMTRRMGLSPGRTSSGSLSPATHRRQSRFRDRPAGKTPIFWGFRST